ncbi:NTP transferase domain-containing protein [Cedecea sp. S5-13]|uniref:phosphocholine cytidylyltransferase family protein n=1 Tax=Cedecea selenatireducens TaxID=3144416 RepID=UPI0035CCF76D
MPIKRAAILLVAGQGKRMGGLTDNYPKCLLPVGESAVIDTLLAPLMRDTGRELVLVTGYQAHKIEEWVRNRYPKNNITFVHNEFYETDVNILSVELGVEALKYPQRGYTIIETDILLDPHAWDRIKKYEKANHSFWLTHGRYSPELTGGIVEVKEPDGMITQVSYQPHYNKKYDNWYKMVGILSVSPQEVDCDRSLRKNWLKKGLQQYYMVPWVHHRQELPCVTVDISQLYARSFNTAEQYQSARDDYLELISNYVNGKKNGN